jgi:hypothetical protein
MLLLGLAAPEGNVHVTRPLLAQRTQPQTLLAFTAVCRNNSQIASVHLSLYIRAREWPVFAHLRRPKGLSRIDVKATHAAF